MDVDITITVNFEELICFGEEWLWDTANTAWTLKTGVMQLISEPEYQVVGFDKEKNTVDINVKGYIEVSE